MFLEIPSDFMWLQPWEPLKHPVEGLVRELQRELTEQHVLYGVPVIPLARRADQDDVLFATGDPSKPLAVVHLTWRGSTEIDPRWPITTTYRGWQDWIEHGLLPDHREYSGPVES
jgi:hypothetical protein